MLFKDRPHPDEIVRAIKDPSSQTYMLQHNPKNDKPGAQPEDHTYLDFRVLPGNGISHSVDLGSTVAQLPRR